MERPAHWRGCHTIRPSFNGMRQQVDRGGSRSCPTYQPSSSSMRHSSKAAWRCPRLWPAQSMTSTSIVSVRRTQGDQMRAADQRLGVSWVISESFRRSMPERTSSRYFLTGTSKRRQDLTTEIVSATLGPALAPSTKTGGRHSDGALPNALLGVASHIIGDLAPRAGVFVGDPKDYGRNRKYRSPC